ncbi:16S rRNA (guanine(527)-N(7))-methyltransferase RsmG [Paenibacillus sp. FSL W8-1187]|uniref:Ribosomal RNA small subunit methyltransferase G n=1 Tax=Paenibacillus pasadenensis TaxID=217090 RepID=A0A2N5NC47_9BACL|nr:MULTISPECIES: 16S rRNA (guanine(527)-N(7))-methyltransferase RsmG [Paenibacillus]PLT47926.1 rRNA small subunit 7-methylguanosine (m7G) methyltransferase GidB [Paenibacillus pasadenensis]QGG58499.1 16S rRNA (guanine(527)-N(7))-methyltransferase RsmG [Paenibacillus sp. B01]
MDKVIDAFSARLLERGIPLAPRQLEQFQRYYELLVDWNERMNLTGITERAAVFEKHFYDSVTLAFYADLSSADRLADIGSGAGFPSLPLKICFPQLQVTIVDSLAKRISFLQHVCEQLGLEDVQCVHGRAEDIGRLPEHRDRYAIVTARAVARMAGLSELCLPFARKGGLFAAMKGADPQEELEEAKHAIRELRGRVDRVETLRLPEEQSERAIILIAKTDATPKAYPRKAGVPLKQPMLKRRG